MSCNNCHCLDCARNRAIARAKNQSNVTDENLDDGWATPIHRPQWQDAEPANEQQARVWGVLVDHLLSKPYARPMLDLLHAVAAGIPGLKPENFPMVVLQVERFIHESPKYEVRMGRVKFKDLSYEEMLKHAGYVARPGTMTMHVHDEVTVQVDAIDNYTCKGCKNEKLSTREKSCWKCGREVGT